MRIVLIYLFVLLAFSCKNKPKVTTDNAKIDNDFEEFYHKFHTDTAYQKAHIQFPLPGIPSFADSVDLVSKDYYWDKDLWVYHKLPDLESSGYKRVIQPLNETMLTEFLINEKDKAAMERRFVKFGNDWFLIYYAGVNGYSEQNKK